MRILIFCLLFCLVSESKSQTNFGSTRPSRYGVQDIYEPFTIDPQLYGIWKQAESSYWIADIFLFDTNRIVIYEFNWDNRRSIANEYKNFLKKGDCYFVVDRGSYRYIGTLSAGRFVVATHKDHWIEYAKTDSSKLDKDEKAILKPQPYLNIKTRKENDFKVYTFYECHSEEPEIDAESDTTYQDYSPVIELDDRVIWGKGRRRIVYSPDDADLYLSLTLEIVTKKNPFEWPKEEKTCPTEKDKDGAIIFGPCEDNKPQLKLTNLSSDTIKIPFEYFSETCPAKLTLIKDNGDTVYYSYGIANEYAAKEIQFIELLPGKFLLLDNKSCHLEEIIHSTKKIGWDKPTPIHEKAEKSPVTGMLRAEFSIVPQMGYGPKEKYWNGKVDAPAIEVTFGK